MSISPCTTTVSPPSDERDSSSNSATPLHLLGHSPVRSALLRSTQYDDRRVIAESVGREDLDLVDAPLHDRGRLVAPRTLQQLDESIGPEEFVVVIAGLGQAIGVRTEVVA